MFRFGKLSTPFKILTMYLSMTLLSEVIGRILVYLMKTSAPVYHFFNVVDYISYASIFYLVIDSLLIRKIILYAFLPVLCLIILNSLVVQKITVFPSNYLLVSCGINIPLSLIFFRQMLNYPETINIFKQSLFWFNCAVLIYFTVTFLDWSCYNYLLRRGFNMQLISSFIYVVNIIYYIMLGGSLILNNKQEVVK
jgi:hypothetical protein